jgi:hypothetical protein
MPISSDNARAPADTPWKPRGIGLAVRFRCAKCDQPAGRLGSGLRFVCGLRQAVCKPCKEAIDARRKT